MIQVKNVKVIISAKELPVLVQCPVCYHISEIMVPLNFSKQPDGGSSAGACHRCGTTFTFDWEKIPNWEKVSEE